MARQSNTPLSSNEVEWNFHPNQKAAYKSKARFKVVSAGRRGGKGILGARWVWTQALKNPGKQIIVAATTYRQLEDVLYPALRDEMPPLFAEYKRADKTFVGSNGSMVMLRSIDNAEALRGLGKDIVAAWLDEFGLYPNYIWDEILIYIFADNEAPVLITGTPKGMNKFYELYQRGLNGGEYESFTWTSYDNPYLPKSAFVEFENLPERVKLQEVSAEFIDDLGGVFHGVRDCIAGLEQPPVPGCRYAIGVDLAKTHDFTDITVLNLTDNHVCHRERFNQLDWDYQISKVKNVADIYPGITYLDSTGVGDPIFDRLRNMGVCIKGIKFTNESKRELIEGLALAISQKRITYYEDPILINELLIYQAEQLPSGAIRYGAPEGYHDDAVISLALAVSGAGLNDNEPFYFPPLIIQDKTYE